jgi:D-3-phosphoglycerate dehydrogenase
MAARQLADYLESGVIHNSVNFPECNVPYRGGPRLLITNRNVPNMVGQVTTVLAATGINIAELLNRHKGELAYNIIDVDSAVPEPVIDRLRAIDGVVRIRCIQGRQ